MRRGRQRSQLEGVARRRRRAMMRREKGAAAATPGSRSHGQSCGGGNGPVEGAVARGPLYSRREAAVCEW
jgi:hypothetical protein